MMFMKEKTSVIHITSQAIMDTAAVFCFISLTHLVVFIIVPAEIMAIVAKVCVRSRSIKLCKRINGMIGEKKMKKEWFVLGLTLVLVVMSGAVREALAQDQALPKVALFFDVGGKEDSGFADSAYKGLEKASAHLAVKAVYVEHTRPLDLERTLNQVAASDAGMIIGVGFAFSEKLGQLAVKYPEKKFVCIDYSPGYDDKGKMVPMPDNLAGITFREEEGSYLVGAIAALKSKTGRIGFLGGMNCPIIRKFEAGYVAGAKAVRPDIRIVAKYAGISGQAFNDPAKGYRIATLMYKDGVDIIYHASGGTGAGLFRAAKEMNRLAIGVDTDESAKAPGLVLTSMTKNLDAAVFEIVRSWLDGYFSGGLKTFGLKEKGVGFVYNEKNMERIGEDVNKKVLELQTKIMDGQLAIPVAGLDGTRLKREDLQNLLSELHLEIKTALARLDGDLKRSAQSLAGRDLKGDDARGALQKLYAANPYIIDCETVSDKGIMLVVEPPAHKTSEGADISRQAHMVRLFKTRRPVLSGSFRSVEGPQAVVIHHPVLSADRRFAGSIAALFAPEYLLSGIVGPVASGLPVGIFLMQTDGRMIYDVKTTQIGLNLFTDPLYKPFPELLKVVRRMAAVPEGKDTYVFYRKPGEAPVEKVVYWRTVVLHGTAWRLGINCAKDRLVKE